MTPRIAALVLAASGCLEVPDGPVTECATTADCDGANGEVCEDGTCWGNPPSGEFAIVVTPPAGSMLVSKEIMAGSISRDGRVDGLQFDTPVRLTGRLDVLCTPPLVCDRAELTASVTVTRPSLFPGGPGVRATAMTSMIAGSVPTFSVDVPPGDPALPYAVTIVPQPRGDAPQSSTSLAELVPPMRLAMPLDVDLTKTILLGGLDLPRVDGTLLAAGGGGLQGYRVVAMGRWEDGAPLTEVSTVAYTGDTGTFQLTLSHGIVGPVEIVARPSDNVAAPTLHLVNVPSGLSAQRTLTEPANLGAAQTRTFTIKGQNGSGELVPIVGARVRVTAQVGTAATGTAVFAAEDITNDAGAVDLSLLMGSAIADAYRLEVVPPASATVGAIFDQPLSMTDSSPTIILPERVRLRGVVRDASGNKLKGVTVTARPSLRFVWSLDDAPQAFVTAIPVSTAVTNDLGEYVVWVDPTIHATWGHYDLVLDPARSTGVLERIPTWVHAEVGIPRDESVDAVTVSDVLLPDAAFVHGPVTDASGLPVKDAEVKVFRMNTYPSTACSARNAPTSCPVPAQLLGRDAADAEGIVELTLPR